MHALQDEESGSSSVWSLFLHCFKRSFLWDLVCTEEYSPKGSCESWFSCCWRGWRCHPKFQEERFKKLNPQGNLMNDSCKAFHQVTENEEGSEDDSIFVLHQKHIHQFCWIYPQDICSYILRWATDVPAFATRLFFCPVGGSQRQSQGKLI